MRLLDRLVTDERASSVPADLYRSVGKRLLDVTVAAVLVVTASPILFGAAVAVRLSSSGPVLFRQQRLGRNGSTFTAFKLRTMTHTERDPSRQVMPEDDDITPVGRILRRTKLDELPQVLNVLRGDMSLVGPRPMLACDRALLDSASIRRLEVRPGMTGVAQVSGNVLLTWPERWRRDVWYVDNLSFGLDLRILLATFQVIVLGEENGSFVTDEDLA